MKRFFAKLGLQAKVLLILLSVILPTFAIVTLVEYRILEPVLQDEIRRTAVSNAKTLASDIQNQRLLYSRDATGQIENYLKRILYSQPLILRIEVYRKGPVVSPDRAALIASTLEDEPGVVPPSIELRDEVTDEVKSEDNGVTYIEVIAPIEQIYRDPKVTRRIHGMIRMAVSLQHVNQLTAAIFRVTALAALFSILVLITLLSYFLRRVIENSRLLRKFETKNIELTEQLHDTQRQLMNTEKLAVMGQLTASFAHEIGTPLNSLAGHFHLLQKDPVSLSDRIEIILAQINRIETIVKNFLQSTSQPLSQSQLIDINRTIEQTLAIARPRIDSLKIEVHRNLNQSIGPIRVVPIEIEQILLNLVTNSLDSIESKCRLEPHSKRTLEISSSSSYEKNQEWMTLNVEDSGEGISKTDLEKVRQPFFTTKPPGQGTGLGLTICEQLVQKYRGTLLIESKKGSWTRIKLRLPYS